MSTRDKDLLARVAMSNAVEPGDRRLAALLAETSAAELIERPETWLFENELHRYMTASSASRVLDQALAAGITPIIPGDTAWPAQLADVENADPLAPSQPLMLWARGDVPLLSTQSVAITGARASTAYGEHITTEIAAELAGQEIAVLAGASYGIDGAAHRAALAAGGKTIAVLASGVDRAYPAGHRELIERIAVDGCVVSEMLPGTAPTRWRFIMRGRIIAALASAVVIPEAGVRSGALSVAQLAHGMARPVGAVPGPVTSAVSAGCHMLVQQGTARLVASGSDVLDMLGGQTDQLETKEA
ncbi:DNA-processing protein DprA [Leucobacter chromiireducens]|uniref:DNA-protecting protein DprA n=1 Tax=Leucobacter chromiireducens subsp. chromiireducens TaxID=660067 RepID=A0ABS1SNB8_9MICO|nr:DNA-processing protein DprA [Leucobacter chromiireducens]MBL3689469.1 DNA-protecting protein DprA [Leucobacter chromiireducens subsp. chromiireducens]